MFQTMKMLFLVRLSSGSESGLELDFLRVIWLES